MGIRSLAGLLFIIGGFFGFLPVLGFWMIPVGLFLIALDIPTLRAPLGRWLASWKGCARSRWRAGAAQGKARSGKSSKS